MNHKTSGSIASSYIRPLMNYPHKNKAVFVNELGEAAITDTTLQDR